MANIIIFDFEVFIHDTLLGAYILGENGKTKFKTWSIEEIIKFYYKHKGDVWVGHNSNYYDDLILEAILAGRNPYLVSNKIVKSKGRFKAKFDLMGYDILNSELSMFGLKVSELIVGKNIHTCPIDFTIKRKLTPEEMVLVEEYNDSDLEQTEYNFDKFRGKFDTRIEIMNDYKLPMEALTDTGTQIAARVLKAKKRPELEFAYKEPIVHENLELENQVMLDFYYKEEFLLGKTKKIKIGKTELTVGRGGIHSAVKKYHGKKLLYFNVSGYYNLIMILLDLLPRTMSEEGKKLYVEMYYDQLTLKKSDPAKRKRLKTILLSVFGAMNNAHTDFYDPSNFNLVTLSGQLFLMDLMEKIEPYCTIVNGNTNGIMVEVFDEESEEIILLFLEEWQLRTGFTLEVEHIYNLFQRDVNCYICQDDEGKVIFKGDAVKNYDISDRAYASSALFSCQEPPIVAQGVVNALIFNKSPEDFVEEVKSNLILFQYSCRKVSFDYLTYDTTDVHTKEVVSTEIPSPSRVFANKDTKNVGMVYKHKEAFGKKSKAKVASLPPTVFVYNNCVTSQESYDIIKDKIDYQYYIDRIYERIGEFI